MIKFRHAFGAIGAVLVVHAFALGFDWYRAIYWFDIPMHYFGGFAIAILAFALWNWIMSHIEIQSRGKKSNPYATLVLQAVFVLGFVMIIGVAWEWYEFLCDQYATIIVREFGFAQMGISDTMDDLVNDTLGAITAFILWRNRS